MPRSAKPASARSPRLRPLVVGVAGGTASGKTWLAEHVRAALGADRCLLIAQDRYYRETPGLGRAARDRINYDRPAALETGLLCAHLDALCAGCEAVLPVYDFTRHARQREGECVRPAPVIVVEGLFVLADAKLRRRFDLTVFVHASADIRLLRRVRRDVAERGRDVTEVLDRYARDARPGHDRHVEPSRVHAALVWDQGKDRAFPAKLLKEIRRRA